MADIDAKTWLESVIIDDDNFTANSPTDVASQQSIKAYADARETASNAYTDAQIAALTFATEGYVDAGDANTLSTAQAYTNSQIGVYGSGGGLATDLLNYHDVIMNSTLGIQLQSTRYDFAAVTPSVTATGALTSPDWVKYADDGGGSTGLWTLAFSPTTEEEVLGTAVFSNNRNPGTDVIPILIWTVPTTGTGTQFVSWGVEYFWPSMGGSLGNTTIISSNTATPTGTLTAGTIYMTQFPLISEPLNGFNAIYIRFFRDAGGVLNTDDYPNDALIGGIGFFYEVNRIGALTTV